jgi:hypothetical protein
MSSSVDYVGLVSISEFVVVICIAAVAAYFALTIRRALFVRLYRNQALGIAISSVTLGLYSWVLTPLGAPPGTSGDVFSTLLGPLIFFSVFVALFYTIDISVRTARLSDPLLRDTLHWRQTRKVLWTLDLLAIAYTIAYVLEGGTQTFVFIVPIMIPLVSGALLFPTIGHRSGDRNLRRHLSWLGAFFVLFIVTFFLEFGLDPLGGVLLVIGTFCLYRGARTLAPLNPLSRSGMTTNQADISPVNHA